ncbi:MAG: SDR family NAD(P)-dependent oxidoreductase [Bacteroidales bacterium]|nr:SDR family NAD(P)-dependent oxidoreductase [Bacteroidales bacterium]MDD3299240.1 SDR family NAD(P)-dependent oxidoreductase [Bacteroidales bacterium]MDD3843670.1 SDR family NAD(P)-dependent oxidoreductase [Bacteroidales bacterium]MDD4618103.1 SDR family NAD(P)-dependent oxidoreductase [Bacteroidales bacterium]
MKDSQKGAIITGSTSGIGRAIAIHLASVGYRVGITGRRIHLLEEISKEFPNQIFIQQFDVSQTETVASNLEELQRKLGGIDLFIHCSGTGTRNTDLILEEELRTIQTNVNGFAAVTNWAFKYFENKGFGKLSAITSIAGLRGFALSPSYSSSKSFQMRYLEALRQKATNLGGKILVTDIRAGFVDTAMGNGDGAFWQTSPEIAARQIISGIDRNKDVLYVTKRWVLIALVMKILPGAIFKRLRL